MLTLVWIALANSIGMAANGFVVNNSNGIRIGRKQVVKSKLERKGLNNKLIPDCETFVEKVEAGDENIAWTLASSRDKKRVSFECEKSADCESVAGRVSVFTDATVTQSVVNGGCHESCSGVRCDEVCRIGYGTGDTDAAITRSVVSGGCHEMSWAIDEDIAKAVEAEDGDIVGAVVGTTAGKDYVRADSKANNGMSDADRLDKARGKYYTKGDEDDTKMDRGEYGLSSDRLTRLSAEQSRYQARSDDIIVGASYWNLAGRFGNESNEHEIVIAPRNVGAPDDSLDA